MSRGRPRSPSEERESRSVRIRLEKEPDTLQTQLETTGVERAINIQMVKNISMMKEISLAAVTELKTSVMAARASGVVVHYKDYIEPLLADCLHGWFLIHKVVDSDEAKKWRDWSATTFFTRLEKLCIGSTTSAGQRLRVVKVNLDSATSVMAFLAAWRTIWKTSMIPTEETAQIIKDLIRNLRNSGQGYSAELARRIEDRKSTTLDGLYDNVAEVYGQGQHLLQDASAWLPKQFAGEFMQYAMNRSRWVIPRQRIKLATGAAGREAMSFEAPPGVEP